MSKKPVAIEESWPAAQVEMWALERIIPYPQNPRNHSPAQVELIARSMREDGVTAPILVDEDGVIIYGHGRRMGAEHNAYARYPVVVARGWSDEKKRAYRIKDNSYALLSTWSPDLLRVELQDLSSAGYEMPLLGFDQVQLVSFLSVPSGADPEATPEPPAKPASRLGDVWILGKHRLTCGSSTDPEAVTRVLAGHKPHLMVSDPPYGVEYDAAFRNGIKRQDGSIVGARAIGKVENDDRADWTEAWELFEGDVAYVWSSSRNLHVVAQSLINAKFDLRTEIVWTKNQIAISRGDYHYQHEPCWYAVRKGKTGHWAGDRKQTTRWDIDKPSASETGHSTQKPIECMRRPIQNNSRPGDYIYEPFCGSGTTIIAAEMMNRYCLAIELNPVYIDVIVQRWQTFAKGVATLEGDGRTFEQIAKARKAGGKNNAPSDTGKPVPGKNGSGDGRKRSVRTKGDAGQPKPGRKPAGKSPAVARNT